MVQQEWEKMSTKIYTGQIGVHLNAFVVCKGIRDVIEPLFKQKYFNAIDTAKANEGKTWTEVFDLIGTGRLAEKWSYPIKYSLFDTPRDVYRLIEELRTFPTHTFSFLDFGYSVSVLANGRGPFPSSNPPLVLVFSERAGDEYRQALEDANVVREYGYWNNTDQPDYVTDAEWEERKKAWDFLSVPADEGFTIPMITQYTIGAEYIHAEVTKFTE